VPKIGGGAKREETHIANMRDESDKASADFGHNPKGWHEFCPRALSRALLIFAILAAPRFAP
jgi:hypothetical protein